MPSFQIIIPYLSLPWALHDCIRSMGQLTCPVLVVDNSPDSDTKHLWNGNQLDDLGIEFLHFPQNYGVAASWNLGLKRRADYTLIVSIAVRFSKSLKEMLELIPERAGDTMCIFEGYHFVAISKKLVDRIGYFDENLYPAYGEDVDWGRRLDLIGAHPESYYDMGNTSIGSGIQKRSQNWYWDDSPYRTGRMANYLQHKWGGPPYCYETPFGNPDNPISYWPEVNH